MPLLLFLNQRLLFSFRVTKMYRTEGPSNSAGLRPISPGAQSAGNQHWRCAPSITSGSEMDGKARGIWILVFLENYLSNIFSVCSQEVSKVKKQKKSEALTWLLLLKTLKVKGVMQMTCLQDNSPGHDPQRPEQRPKRSGCEFHWQDVLSIGRETKKSRAFFLNPGSS